MAAKAPIAFGEPTGVPLRGPVDGGERVRRVGPCGRRKGTPHLGHGEGAGRGDARTDGLSRRGGMGALLSGLVFLVTVLYAFVYLARLGLKIEMLDQPRRLLPWIAANEGAYLGLWWIYLASPLCLLPDVPTLYRCTPAAGGGAGVVVGIVGAATNA